MNSLGSTMGIGIIAAVLSLAGTATMSAASVAAAVAQAQRSTAFAQLPMHFEANQGQADRAVKFLARGMDFSLALTGDAVLVRWHQPGIVPPDVLRAAGQRRTKPARRAARHAIRMQLLGANPDAEVIGVEELAGKVNYLIGHDPTRWRSHIPTYAKVRLRDVYPGVDLLYSGRPRLLEYSFIVAPSADPESIAVAFTPPSQSSGRRPPQFDTNGDLSLPIGLSAIQLRRPKVVQEVNGVLRDIAGHYVAQAQSLASADGPQRFRLQVGAYDRAKPLIITAGLGYATYLGGHGADVGAGIAIDAAGHAYVTGSTLSPDFPTVPRRAPFREKETDDAFVAKLSPDGSTLIYATYFGGSGNDSGAGIAVDAQGSAYITGETSSDDFPTTPGAFQPHFGGGRDDFVSDAFVAKLSPQGSVLMYASYLGGSDGDSGAAIAIDAMGHAYVAGTTFSDDFPTSTGALQTTFGGSFTDGFVARIGADGTDLVYATYLGGSDEDACRGLAVDALGHAYVTGDTESADFPRPKVSQAAPGGGTDAFVVKLKPDGTSLLYTVYLGGGDFDSGAAVVVDATSQVYVVGHTFSVDFPTTPAAFQPGFGGGFVDAFVAKVNAGGTVLVYASYLGGNGDDVGEGIAVDATGAAYLTGLTESADFPVSQPLQENLGGTFDAFATKVHPTGSSLLYSTYLGGRDGDRGFAIAVDELGNAYIVGLTGSPDFPTAYPLQARLGGSLDAFVVLIAENLSGRCQGNGEAFVLGAVRAQSSPFYLPVREVTLTLNGPGGCLEVTGTNALGFYRFRELAAGTYTVTPTKPGCLFTPPERTVDLEQRAAPVWFTGVCQ
jgi:hypothetical protein